jgi:hypothetical protein
MRGVGFASSHGIVRRRPTAGPGAGDGAGAALRRSPLRIRPPGCGRSTSGTWMCWFGALCDGETDRGVTRTRSAVGDWRTRGTAAFPPPCRGCTVMLGEGCDL